MSKKFVVVVDGIAVSDKFHNESDAEIFVQGLEEEDGIQPESISIKNLYDLINRTSKSNKGTFHYWSRNHRKFGNSCFSIRNQQDRTKQSDQ